MTSTNIPELRLRTGGLMRFRNQIIGHAHFGGHGSTAPRGLLVALEHIRPESHSTTDPSPGGFLKVPHRLPPKVVWKGSRTQAVPEDWLWVDDDSEEQVDIEKWTWEDVGVRLGDEESTYLACSSTIAGLTSLYEAVVQFRATKMPSVLSLITSHGNAFLLFPLIPYDNKSRTHEKQPSERDLSWTCVQVFRSSPEIENVEKATTIDVNPPFGLCTVGTNK